MNTIQYSLNPTVASILTSSVKLLPIFNTSAPIPIDFIPSTNSSITEFVLLSTWITLYLVSTGLETTSKLSPTLSWIVSENPASESL